jgi:hypothetical protein
MAKNKITSDVSVTLTVQVRVNSTWNENTTLAQIHRQAKEEAEFIIKKALTGKAQILKGATITVLCKT